LVFCEDLRNANSPNKVINVKTDFFCLFWGLVGELAYRETGSCGSEKGVWVPALFG